MIEKIRIQNFKSIHDLELEVGRVNLLIGENGSGKSNILEALVFASASDSNKLDNEFLYARGLRVTEPELMRSAFEEKKKTKNVNIVLIVSSSETIATVYEFENENSAYSQWFKKRIKIETIVNGVVTERSKEDRERIDKLVESALKEYRIINFIIFAPENSILRNFYAKNQLEPLGFRGEGLFKLLRVVHDYEDKSYFNTIVESLQLFGWFESMEPPQNREFGEKKLVIKDKFLYRAFDEYSTNEGFLYILFYITLIVAKETPKIFAIDNVDNALNPKLCRKVMTVIADLAKKYDKQIFLTTHNPAILDGIDLNDDEQRLLVVSRDEENGQTWVKRITAEEKPKSSDNEPLNLSEAFLRGYLGGLPENF